MRRRPGIVTNSEPVKFPDQQCSAMALHCVRETRPASAYDDLSHGSVRFGQPVLAFTYSSAVELISGSTLSLIGAIEGTVVFHLVPSHSTSEMPLWPLWSAQLRWIGEAKPGRPNSFQRASVMLRFSKPRRTSSLLTCFLPVNCCAVRIAS